MTSIPELKAQLQASTCIGRVYRYHETAYLGKRNDINITQRLVPLKRMSCPGCEKCDWVDDDVAQGIVDVGVPYIEFDPKLQHNDMAYLHLITDGYDWETGTIDSWHLKAVKYTPDSDK